MRTFPTIPRRLKVIFLVFGLTSTLIVSALASSLLLDDPPVTKAAEPNYLTYFPFISVEVGDGPYDMARFMVGDGRLYEVQHSWGPQTRFQTQKLDFRFFHTKGIPIAEWEELWATSTHIMRGTDTSPGNGMYYTLRDPGIYGSAWSPRYWDIGDTFERNPLVTFYYKGDCSVVRDQNNNPIQFWQRSYLRFQNYYDHLRFESGIILNNVVELAWLLTPNGAPVERYYYAEKYGLVGWRSNDGRYSYISEIPDGRPDNVMESIPCLSRSATAPLSLSQTLIGPFEPPYRAK